MGTDKFIALSGVAEDIRKLKSDTHVARLCKRIISMAYAGPVSPPVIDDTISRSRKSRRLGPGLLSIIKGPDRIPLIQGVSPDIIAICVNRQS